MNTIRDIHFYHGANFIDEFSLYSFDNSTRPIPRVGEKVTIKWTSYKVESIEYDYDHGFIEIMLTRL